MTRGERAAAGFLCAAILLGTVVSAAGPDTSAAAAPAASGAADAAAQNVYNGSEIVLRGADAAGAQIAVIDELAGRSAVLRTEEEGYAEWRFTAAQSGSYRVRVDYHPLDGNGDQILRDVTLDGVSPGAGFSGVAFSRVYRDGERRTVQDGNDIRPAQVEVQRWSQTELHDPDGYSVFSLCLSVTAGEHTLRLTGVQEPMAIDRICLISAEESYPTYREALSAWQADGAEQAEGDAPIVRQAEDMHERSAQTLYASCDNTSAANRPYHYRWQKLNVVSSGRWKEAGQWISWTVDVPSDGLYRLGFRFRQNVSRRSVRCLTIDGVLPFAEAAELVFRYRDAWQVSLAGDEESGEPYLFYLSAGQHELRMEVTVGEIGTSLIRAEETLSSLNAVSWALMTVLGTDPDTDRDYGLATAMPEQIEAVAAAARELRAVAQTWVDLSGERDSAVAEVEQLASLLEDMADDPGKIPARYSYFRDQLSSFANLLVTSRGQPLTLDYLFLAPKDAELPQANAGFFTALRCGVLRFLSSFVTDYDSLTDLPGGESGSKIKVWVGNGLSGGRDQAQVLQQLVEQEFTADHRIGVELQLVPAGTVLTATLAGKGPDVALQVAAGDAVNYAMRHAVVDLSALDGFDEVAAAVDPALYVGYTYQGGKYGLPETMSFPMLFYRRDVLERIGIDVTALKTWDDVIAALPALQANNMNMAIPAQYLSYYLFLFQNGGTLYRDGGKTSALGERAALDAFHTYMRFYTSYGLPFNYSFETRFRTGEIPLGVADYTTYNLLKISAPEISGLWGMTAVPGTRRADGTVDASVPVSSAGCVMMTAAKDRDACWAFMRWWVSTEVQFAYGKELECAMGAGARYNTADLAALQRLPWPAKDRRALLSQLDALTGIPEVAGGYITQRNVEFALRSVYNENSDARAALLSYIDAIDSELTAKRREFKLDEQ